MTPLSALLLGITQGLTEFLPVSSSGHLLLLRTALGLGEISPAFDVVLHLGTLAAVLICLRKQAWQTLKSPKKLGLIAVATLPAAAVGLLLGDKIEAWFYSGDYLWITFLLTAALLLSCEIIETVRAGKASAVRIPLRGIKLESAAVMGFMQAAALLPGLSRSGCTIFGGVLCGAKREETAVFSFLMSVPIILGSAVLSITRLDVGWIEVFIGLIASLVGGMIAIKLMLRVISKANYKWFTLYLAAVSVISIFV